MASSTPNIKQVFANSPLLRVSDPVPTTLAVEGEPEVLALVTTPVSNACYSTLPYSISALQFASTKLAIDFRFGAATNSLTSSSQSQRPIFTFLQLFI